MAARALLLETTAAPVGDDAGPLRVGIDPHRTPRAGDLVVVDPPGGGQRLVGLWLETGGAPTLLTPERTVPLGATPLVGVVTLLVRDL